MVDTAQVQGTAHIRNVAVIAHVDHGKSTLADRIIQLCRGSDRSVKDKELILDSLELEQERGITIKAAAVRLDYRSADQAEYQLNVVDTPGHVDFSYEVSRSLAACDGAILIVDATQGVQSQTVAHCYEAAQLDIEILPVINKIDLPAADVNRTVDEIEDLIGIDASNAITVSGKTGAGVPELLEELVRSIPAPSDASYQLEKQQSIARALIVDSWYDPYRGVMSLVRVVNGTLRPGHDIVIGSTSQRVSITELGVFDPHVTPIDALNIGEIGWMCAQIRDVRSAPVGDTIFATGAKRGTLQVNADWQPLEGFELQKPRVWGSIFPQDSDRYREFADAIEKYALNDVGFEYSPTVSSALGSGYRCGFSGQLHMEVVAERLAKEFDVEVITTSPGVECIVHLKNGEVLHIADAAQFPDRSSIDKVFEPMVTVSIHAPSEFLGEIVKLCLERRGVQQSIRVLERLSQVVFLMPLAEIVHDMHDRLKSATRGFGSMDYADAGTQESDIVRIDITVNEDPVDALAILEHRSNAQRRGRAIVQKLVEKIPRQMFAVAVRATIGGKIIARETVRAMRKNVTAKCYGGDATRKKKLLEKQRAGKKKMRTLGKVSVPADVFRATFAQGE